MRHGFAQRCVDVGLSPLPCGLEGFENVGVYPHIQVQAFTAAAGLPRPRLMLDCCQYAATAAASLGS